MSIIVPAGKKNIVWSPKEKKEVVLKTAQVEEKPADECCEENDPLFDAAKDFADQAGKGDGAVVEVESVGAEKAEDEGKSELKDAVQEVKDAVEKVEVAVDKVEGAEEAEIEVEVGEEPADEVEIEVEDVPGEQEVSSGEVMVVSDDPSKCACAKSEKKEVKEAKKEECKECKKTPCECKKEDKKEEVKEAASEEEFCRFGKLSAINKKKVADYWVNYLGFPKDYVNLMVKDYEK